MNQRYPFPRPKPSGEFDYSFSGLKTAAVYYLQDLKKEDEVSRKDFAASYQEAIVDSLMGVFKKACKRNKSTNNIWWWWSNGKQKVKRKIKYFC